MVLLGFSHVFPYLKSTGVSGVAEMGYRTKPFHRIMERAETSLREFLRIPDSHEAQGRSDDWNNALDV